MRASWMALRDRFDTYVTIRGDSRAYARFGLFDTDRTIPGVDVAIFDTVVGAVAALRAIESAVRRI